ncbi:MAG: polysaccharide lyase family 8 super-sandwich domain-containing protein, partial [Bacteroidota bacterium]
MPTDPKGDNPLPPVLENTKKTKSILFVIVAALCTIHGTFALKSDMETIKRRVVQKIMDKTVDDTQVRKLVDSQNEDGTWPGIDYKDLSREGFAHRIHYTNMLRLAEAYRIKSSKFHKKREVLKCIERALEHWARNDYICENWWYNQIGTPGTLVNLILLVGKELPKDLIHRIQQIIGRAHSDAQGARPGGDRIKIASIEAKNMLYLDNKEHFGKIMGIIEGEVKHVTWIGTEYGYGYRRGEGGFENRTEGGRGIQYDNSFHHRNDGVNNTLSYGLGYANAFIEWATYTANTTYSFSEEKIKILIDYFLDGICKTAVYGKFPDPGAKNRSVSRPGTLKAYNTQMPEALLALSEYRCPELKEIVAIREKGIPPTTSHATFYRHTEHFSFQRPGFFTSVRMYSSRVHNMEYPYNSEGFLNHYRGDGANHISVSGDEYYDIWPVYDYQKIPGTTVVQQVEMPPRKQVRTLGITDFVGAVTDGRYAAVAMDLKRRSDTLSARKSWFFFDQEYVCLGTGISTQQELPVFTTLNQSLLRDTVVLKSKDSIINIQKGEGAYPEVSWVFHDKVGYIFPELDTVHLKAKEQTGSWWRINNQTDSSKEEVSKGVFSLWLDHGVEPKRASYQYMVVPGTTAHSLERENADRSIAILSNTPNIQAVLHRELGICQVVFYRAGEIPLSENLVLGSDGPGMVMLKLEGSQIHEISVADPNR